MKPIVQDGDPVLRETATEVAKDEFGTKVLNELIEDMREALEKEPDGVAIAAPQIGVAKRVFLVRYDRMLPPNDAPRTPLVGIFINPKLVKTSRKRVETDEGCLSVRGKYGTTLRFERVTVQAKDEQGKNFERGGGGILAQAFQHEIDHLDGVLFTDHAEDVYEARRNDHE